MQISSHFTANGLLLEEFPFKSELAMAGYLADNPEVISLDRENYFNVTILETEKALDIGRTDLIADYNGEIKAVIEIKKGLLDENAKKQLEGYLGQIRKIDPYSSSKLIGVLVGSSLAEDVRKSILSGANFEGIPIAALVVRRFRSKDGQIFVLTDSFFDISKATRDYTKYFVNQSNPLTKNRLVLEVIKSYLKANPELTFDELSSIFSWKIQGNQKLGIVILYDHARLIMENDRPRHFLDDNDLLRLKCGQVVSVCNQWGKDNIEGFLKIARDLGFEIQEIKSKA